MSKKNIRTLEEFTTEHYGKKGTPKRDKLDKGYAEFKLGVLIHDARLAIGLTQEQLADKCGTTKTYISRIENNASDIRLSTLMRIIHDGLGGHLKLSLTV